ALIFYLLADKKQDISYSVSNEEIIASPTSASPDLSFIWKGNRINKELKRFKVAVWNSGNTYIDRNMLSTTEKLRIKIEGSDSEILELNISSTSRPSLHIRAELNHEEQAVTLSIDGDDGLEQGDGFVVSMIYTGSPKPKATLEGRIKGINKEFTYTNWSEINNGIAKNKKWAIAIALFFLLNATTLLITSTQKLLNKPKLKLFFYDTAGILIGIGLFYSSIALLAMLFTSVYYNLKWVT
ncbi:MAG TPA: hypothetical protein PKE57_05645, partial [Cellvibrionaceae bacterium]|nr:hypothetical protein [Cellvibrionaceae bacterium]